MTRRAVVLLAAQVAVNLALWVPLPLAVLWVASQLQYRTDSLAAGVAAGFAVLYVGLAAGTRTVRRIDAAWLSESRVPWRDAALGSIATTCAVVGGGGFAVWLLLVGGMQSSIFPSS